MIKYLPFRKIEKGEIWDEYLKQFCYYINQQMETLFRDYEQKMMSTKEKSETTDNLTLGEKMYCVLEDLKDYIDKYGHHSGDLDNILYQLENIKKDFDKDYNNTDVLKLIEQRKIK